MVYNKTDLAKITGLSRATISKIFNSKGLNPKIETMEKIALALDCSIEDLRKKIKKEEIWKNQHQQKEKRLSKLDTK